MGNTQRVIDKDCSLVQYVAVVLIFCLLSKVLGYGVVSCLAKIVGGSGQGAFEE